MAIYHDNRLDETPALQPAYDGPQCRWLFLHAYQPDAEWRRPSPVPGVPSIYEFPSDSELKTAAAFVAAVASGEAAWHPAALEGDGPYDGVWAPVGVGEHAGAPGYRFVIIWPGRLADPDTAISEAVRRIGYEGVDRFAWDKAERLVDKAAQQVEDTLGGLRDIEPRMESLCEMPDSDLCGQDDLSFVKHKADGLRLTLNDLADDLKTLTETVERMSKAVQTVCRRTGG